MKETECVFLDGHSKDHGTKKADICETFSGFADVGLLMNSPIEHVDLRFMQSSEDSQPRFSLLRYLLYTNPVSEGKDALSLQPFYDACDLQFGPRKAGMPGSLCSSGA